MKAKFASILAGKFSCARPGCGRRLFFAVQLERDDGTRFVIGEDCAKDIGLLMPKDDELKKAKGDAVNVAIESLLPLCADTDDSYVKFYRENSHVFGDTGRVKVLRRLMYLHGPLETVDLV